MSLENPIILLSTGRAGSTLFSEVLFRHREIAFPSNYNEKFPRFPAISAVRNIFDNRFYRNIGVKKQQYNSPAWYNKFVFTPSESWAMWQYIIGPQINFSREFLLGQHADPQLIERVRNYFSQLLFWQRRKRLAFKITGPSRIAFLTSIFPDAQFIRIKRDPFATVHSFLNAPFWQRQGAFQLWWRGAYSSQELDLVELNKDNPVWMTSFQIKRVLETTEIEIGNLNKSVIEVCFEDFILNPLDYTTHIFNTLGLKLDNYSLNYFKEIRVQNTKGIAKAMFSESDLALMNEIFNCASCIS